MFDKLINFFTANYIYAIILFFIYLLYLLYKFNKMQNEFYKKQLYFYFTNSKNTWCSFVNILNNQHIDTLVYIKKENWVIHVFKLNEHWNIIDQADWFYWKFEIMLDFNKYKLNKINWSQNVTILFMYKIKEKKVLYFKTWFINLIYLKILKLININYHFYMLNKINEQYKNKKWI